MSNDKTDGMDLHDAVLHERAKCAKTAKDHADFCRREAENGGSKTLFERAKGAAHIAQRITERGSKA